MIGELTTASPEAAPVRFSAPRPIRQRLACRLLVVLFLGAAASSLAACTSFQADLHLAPVYTRMSIAGGDREHEALGGALALRNDGESGALRYWAMRPLYSQTHLPTGRKIGHLLPPLGKTVSTYDSYLIRLLPIFRYHQKKKPSGFREWTWVSLPLFYLAQREDKRMSRAWFPFFGRLEGFLSYDSLSFVLWPILTRTERDERTAWHFLFPFFGRATGKGGSSLRLWPIYGHAQYEGRYDRRFVLWPLFHYHRNNIKADPAEQETKWMVWPFFGRSSHGTFQSTTVLWPFFGYASNPATGFESWDGPWPIVRVQRPGEDREVAFRSRFWPFYSYFEGDGLRSLHYAWPLGSLRTQEHEHGVRKTSRFVPFWQNIESVDRDEKVRAYQKLWPLYKAERTDQRRSLAFPALNPLWPTPAFDDHWAWLWELWRVEVAGPERRERAWLGLWRREKDEHEDRVSLVGLFARRKYTFEGDPVTETSFLFGLLRFRSRKGHGVRWLAPSIPGPGWPSRRVPSVELAKSTPVAPAPNSKESR